jgi:predicted nucleic acid-binding protein
MREHALSDLRAARQHANHLAQIAARKLIFLRVTRYPKIRARLKPVLAGRLINDLREIALLVETLPPVDVSPDPYDNYLLALASGGAADLEGR